MRPNKGTETETPETGTGTGRRWARTGAIVGGLVSVSANVTHAFILDHATGLGTTVSVLSGLLWPSLLMVMTEVIIYNTFKGWSFSLKAVGFPPVAVIAAVSSYLHMRGLLGYAGEGWFISQYGPLAIDGAMVVCSGALMLTRPGQSRETVETETVSPAVSVHSVPPVIETPETVSVPVTVRLPIAVETETETIPETLAPHIETETPAETETETVSVPRVRRLPAMDGLPTIQGLTRNRVAQVMEIRKAVPSIAERASAELTLDRCGEILGITGRGSLVKVKAAVLQMDAADAQLPELAAAGVN